MEAYDVSYFCRRGKPPLAQINTLEGYLEPSIVVHINHEGTQSGKPSVTLHIAGEQDLINFKNSVLWAYEEYNRKRGAA